MGYTYSCPTHISTYFTHELPSSLSTLDANFNVAQSKKPARHEAIPAESPGRAPHLIQGQEVCDHPVARHFSQQGPAVAELRFAKTMSGTATASLMSSQSCDEETLPEEPQSSDGMGQRSDAQCRKCRSSTVLAKRRWFFGLDLPEMQDGA